MSNKNYLKYKGNSLPIDTADLGGDITTFGESLLTSANSSVAQTNLSLVPNVNVQTYSSILTSWASKTVPTGTVVGTTDTQTLTNKTITGLKETKTTSSGNNFDLSAGNFFTHTLSGVTSFTLSNVPSSGTVASFILDLTNGGSANITWWTTIKWVSATQPTLTASGRDVLGFYTHDGGTTWNGFLIGKDVK